MWQASDIQTDRHTDGRDQYTFRQQLINKRHIEDNLGNPVPYKE